MRTDPLRLSTFFICQNSLVVIIAIMIDLSTISEDNKEKFYKLVITSPEKNELLPIIQEVMWYQMLFASKTLRLL